MARHIVDRYLMVACGLVVLGGCGAGGPPSKAVMGLHFTTSSEIPTNPQPVNVDVTLTDPIRSRAIYTATLALPEVPAGRTNCPSDAGIRHAVDFMDAQSTVFLTAVLNPGGCREVQIAGSPDRQAADPDYWTLLAQNLGIQESTLFAFAP